MAEVTLFQSLWHVADITFEDLEALAIQRSVLSGKIGIGRLDFETAEVQTRDPRAQRQCRRADAASKVKYRITGFGFDRSCQKDGVRRRPVSRGRL